MAIGLACLVASGVLAAIVHHDGVGLDASSAAHAPVGSHVRLRGTPVAHAAVAIAPLPSLIEPAPGARLDNFTYTLDAGDAVLWLTSPTPRNAGASVIVEGTVIARARTSEPRPRPVTIVQVDSWTEPILFR